MILRKQVFIDWAIEKTTGRIEVKNKEKRSKEKLEKT